MNANDRINLKILEEKIKKIEQDNIRLKRENARIIFSLHHEFRAIWATLKGLYLVDNNISNHQYWITTFDRAERMLNDMAKDYVIVKITKKFKK